ncbi:uncharacterized protein EV422DRAFT_532154 [Fimicolochytrium jonesii]|uniref:uncharacterized protein n=1 Tax=Fimicolochytrium jonesii TaxID=1396493 RepID=UPI0022FE5677|nr:uncharacterized protein EV422DRAFT_532154 [Fimicolochytrium jonesii]KAI8820249.1 hypothetical protein EV422DRAFT_532154 [Fimicolochytrium jonesii]
MSATQITYQIPCSPANSSTADRNPCLAFHPRAVCSPAAVTTTQPLFDHVCTLSPQDAATRDQAISSLKNRNLTLPANYSSTIFFPCVRDKADPSLELCSRSPTSICPEGYFCGRMYDSTIVQNGRTSLTLSDGYINVCMRNIPQGVACSNGNSRTFDAPMGYINVTFSAEDVNRCESTELACSATTRRCEPRSQIPLGYPAIAPNPAGSDVPRQCLVVKGATPPFNTCPCGYRCINNGTCVDERVANIRYPCANADATDVCPVGWGCDSTQQSMSGFPECKLIGTYSPGDFVSKGRDGAIGTPAIIMIIGAIVGGLLVCIGGCYYSGKLMERCSRGRKAKKARGRAEMAGSRSALV